MKKDYHFTIVDNTVRCKVCGQPIKTRLIMTKQPQNRTKCYKCYNEKRKLGVSHRKALI